MLIKLSSGAYFKIEKESLLKSKEIIVDVVCIATELCYVLTHLDVRCLRVVNRTGVVLLTKKDRKNYDICFSFATGSFYLVLKKDCYRKLILQDATASKQ